MNQKPGGGIIKQGFTLIELLTLIAIPVVDKLLKASKDDLYEVQINNILGGAKNWSAAHMEDLPTEPEACITLTLGQLQRASFVDLQIKNPQTGELFPTNMLLRICYRNHQYIYEISDGSGDHESNYDPLAPIIILNGLETQYVEIHTSYADPGVIVQDTNGQSKERMSLRKMKTLIRWWGECDR